MEIGSLVCRPRNPLCDQCPLTKNCLSFKRNDFKITNKFRKIINKSFLVTCYKNNNKILLVKNNKFNFLKNLLIFPMKEISPKIYSKNLKKKINLKISNMNMEIQLKIVKRNKNLSNGLWIEKSKLNNFTLPTFTKNIYNSIEGYL